MASDSVEDLLVCINNIQEVAGLLTQPGRRYIGPGGESKAATIIQAAWRGHLTWREHSKEVGCCNLSRACGAVQASASADGEGPPLQLYQHFVDTMMALEAAQLVRLCDLAEPLVEVLLILPSPPEEDVIAYWDKILEVYRSFWPENHSISSSSNDHR
eukprot:gene31418-6586_t